MKIRRNHVRRLLWLALFLGALSVACGLILFALKQNINLFYTPSQIQAHEAPVNQSIRIGGLVVSGSIERFDHLAVVFKVSDLKHTVQVHYQGILPDLFRENQGVVANGYLNSEQQFIAREILAKHDENYRAPEVTRALQQGGDV